MATKRAATTKKKGPLTPEHLEALEIGRREGRVVKQYLEALEQHKPKRGRKRTVDTVKSRLTNVENMLVEANGIERLVLLQERIDLSAELDALQTKVDLVPIEDEFVAVAAAYSARKRIAYGTWREMGVAPAVLKRAGISRSA